jgi:hypothetical protein
MPPSVHHQAPDLAQALAHLPGDRRTKRILTLPGLVMQEMRATQANRDLRRTPEMQ